MTEMQGAVGIVQLEKLEYIVDTNRKNKSIIKNIIKKSDKIKFRRITDETGELGDTIIFNFDNQNTAERMVELMTKAGLGTKNVPDANNWHFAKNWHQVWSLNDKYQYTYQTIWNKTNDLLNRSISLPIMVSWDENYCIEYGNKILNIINSL